MARKNVSAMCEKLMPVAVSVVAHLGVVVILTFVFMMVPEVTRAMPTVVTTTPPSQGEVDSLTKHTTGSDRDFLPTPMTTLVTTSTGDAPKLIDEVAGRCGLITSPAPVGVPTGQTRQIDEGIFPPARGAPARNIVFLIDASGSMTDTFGSVCLGMLNRISRLAPEIRYHVIFFSSGKPVENPDRRLIPATPANKARTARFLEAVMPAKQTDPIPAMRRAFEVLRRDVAPGGKLIYLLTDGEFPDNDAVLRELGKLNKDQRVRIDTILYHYRPPVAERVLETIAERNGGKFYFREDEMGS